MDGWQRNHRVHIYLDKQINKEYKPVSFSLFTLHILHITFCFTASWKGEELMDTLHNSSPLFTPSDFEQLRKGFQSLLESE